LLSIFLAMVIGAIASISNTQAASAATTSTVVGTACYVGSTEYAWVKGDLDNSHPPAKKFTPSWWNGVINYKITFTGITNPGWAWIWFDCNIAPDRGAWVRTYPGQTSTLNY
jgi:hypothetical protein